MGKGAINSYNSEVIAKQNIIHPNILRVNQILILANNQFA